MTKTFKKIAVSVMAVMTIAMGTTSIAANAAGPLRAPSSVSTFSVGSSTATAELYVAKSQANASTALRDASYVRATITVTAKKINSYSVNNGVKVQGTYVSVNAAGENISKADSKHYAEKGSYNGSTSMTRNA